MLKFFRLSSLALLLATLPLLTQAQLKYLEGEDYTTIASLEKTAQPVIHAFFWYGCGHCFHLDGQLQKWLHEEKPADVDFELIPAIASSRWQPSAQFFYTAKALNIAQDKLQHLAFTEIQEKNNVALLFEKKEMAKFLQREFAIDAAAFDKAWDSFEVARQVKRAKNLFNNYKLDGVPVFVVNGKYVVQNDLNTAKIFATLLYLYEK